MQEAAFVFNGQGETIGWHQPPGCTSIHIPDSRELWEFLWEHRHNLGGVAHLHPWKGTPVPSNVDEATFHAIETALGRLLLWPVISLDDVRYYCWNIITKRYVPCGPPSFESQLEVGTLRILGAKQDAQPVPVLSARQVGKSVTFYEHHKEK